MLKENLKYTSVLNIYREYIHKSKNILHKCCECGEERRRREKIEN
jgi:hypothetical protein